MFFIQASKKETIKDKKVTLCKKLGERNDGENKNV